MLINYLCNFLMWTLQTHPLNAVVRCKLQWVENRDWKRYIHIVLYQTYIYTESLFNETILVNVKSEIFTYFYMGALRDGARVGGGGPLVHSCM